MEILSFNTGYFLGYAGTVSDYLRHPLRGVIGTKQESSNIRAFVDLLQDVDPDLALLQEIDQGSLRTRTDNQMEYITRHCSKDFEYHATTKYGNHLLSRSPMLRYMSNGLLYKNGTVTDHFLDSGVKSLVHEIQIDDISVFSVHLARFGARIRKRQLTELSSILDDRENVLVVGDFNALRGVDETAVLEHRSGLSIAHPGNTFPSGRPSYPLDLAAYSPHLSVQCQKLDKTISDHNPIIVTVER